MYLWLLIILKYPVGLHEGVEPHILRNRKTEITRPGRLAIRTKHYSLRTEEAYLQWIKRYILFHHKRHPAQMGEKEINAFLNHRAVNEHVAAKVAGASKRQHNYDLHTCFETRS